MPRDPDRLTARIEVFRPGTFTPLNGAPITYSAADLKAIADSYDPETAPAPIVVGHPETDAPAFGWVERFEYDAGAERLNAHLGDIEPAFADLVKAGRFRKVSMAFFRPDQGHNPVPGTWYPKHIGFLGAAAPAVSGLKNASFASAEGAIFTTDFGAGEEAARLFRGLRDFFIERFGLEESDRALPAWQIDWLEDADDPKPRFAAPATPESKEPKVTKPDPAPDAADATRTADLDAREAELAAREAAAAHAEHAAFAEGLVTEGRLLPASKDQVTALLDALPGEATVAFAEGGEKIAPGAALRQLLAAQPKIVAFGEHDLGDDPEAGAAAAFAADGKPVDRAALDLHARAMAWQKEHPGTDYISAVKAVS
ncbi:Phage protein [Rhodovulum sp. P5]|uniref:hypothetical protein n=1 Tax=Rhodovulum sp. P5 TaxID=1564506 RepID=UPI0009C3CCF4|nr:hypothetical protein [Rhodovulum sp. P5]ARE40903.1 Phage protein [Rhodovulum sp. P5]